MKMSKQNKITFIVIIPGEHSSGIFDLTAKVTIEDNCVYDTEELFLDLIKSVASIYNDNATVKTELNFLESELKVKTIELGFAEDCWNALATDLENKDANTEMALQKDVVNAKKDVANLKRKINKLKKQYDQMNLWYPKT